MITSAQFDQILPLACAWAEQQEGTILRDGVPLTDAQLQDARTVGVVDPGRVRLLCVPAIPRPTNPTLVAAAAATNLLTPMTAGMALRFGIFVRSDCWGRRELVVHELVHTSQYERLGGFAPFLRQYLMECFTIGYPAAPMEQEAVTKTQMICG